MEDTHFSPRDMLGASKWTSILFTTYSLSLSFLEAVPLAAVNRTFKNFKVLTDLEGYLSSLSDVGAIGVGRDYDLVPIKVAGGVFHPKIALLEDEGGNIRATVGSGNLSFGGWGYNHEVLEILRPGHDSRCFAELSAMLEAIATGAMAGGRIECMRPPGLAQFVEMARRASLQPGEGRSRLLHTVTGPLVPQLRDMAEELGGARAISVVSPFFSQHAGVKALASGLDCDDVSVMVPLKAPSMFDFVEAAEAGFPCKKVTSDLFEDRRSLHSKLFDIQCRRGRLIVTGSANATLPALLGRNVEAVVVRTADISTSLGWRPTTRSNSVSTEEREPVSCGGAGLVVDFNGGLVTGRVTGLGASGQWEAFISSGTRRQQVGMVTVDPSGKFSFTPPPTMDPLSLATAAQVILIREDVELRGWLILRDLISAISRRGPIARVINRIMSGLDSLADVGSILDFFARDPQVLFDAAARAGGGKSERKDAIPFFGGSLSAVRGTSAFDMDSAWTGLEGSRSGEALIEALVRHLASAMPQSHDDAADDSDDDLEPTSTGRGERKPSFQKPQVQRLQRPIVERAFEELFLKLEEAPAGPMRAPGLFVLFDMMIQIVPRTEAPDELLHYLMRRWLRAAMGVRSSLPDTTSLDQCVSIIAARIVIFDPKQAPRMHGVLQTWIGGELDEDFKLLFEPTASGTEERRIYPEGRDVEWKQAWALIVTSKTQWSLMKELKHSLDVGAKVVAIPQDASQMERSTIEKVALGKAKLSNIVYLTSRRSPKVACPACNMGLALEQRGRLNAKRIASCTSMRCGRVVIDLSL
ncbi:phospholipase D family protein [Rhizobium leguminosarum]|uniref:phospholipase D family protein n=1 Tax=Rhizobium leguminosarum TaxID=384 RepID=UPI001C93FA28|nr:phospholipase D family protein [Rhizobium leguminosarum]MBY5660450.1 hypothetical protein [Rhizobium leguminosarum]MBY5674073.1 hypothetical protein [Rhizobium leguminosarum]